MSAASLGRIMKAANRYEVLVQVECGSLTMQEAANLLNLSLRQTRRLRRRSEQGGLKGLIFQREHRAWNEVDPAEQRKVLSLRQRSYRAYNLSHFRDVVRDKYAISRSREYYRKLFLSKGLYEIQHKRKIRKKSRKRFEAPASGVLIQRDTSIHLWVPYADKPWKLILDLDDHSRKILGCQFSERDDVVSNMLVAWETISENGIPMAYYMDNNAIYNPIRHLQKKPGQYRYFRYRNVDQESKETLPQFKRALLELGIECIHSTPYEPQGKGKIERLFRFMQDRLLNEMVTAKVKTIAEGNKYLKKWVKWYNHNHVHSTTKMIPNERFIKSEDRFRQLNDGINLNKVFSLRYERQVKADNTFSFEGRTYQLPKNKYRYCYARAKIELRLTMKQRLKVYYKKTLIADFSYKQKKNNSLTNRADILALQ